MRHLILESGKCEHGQAAMVLPLLNIFIGAAAPVSQELRPDGCVTFRYAGQRAGLVELIGHSSGKGHGVPIAIDFCELKLS